MTPEEAKRQALKKIQNMSASDQNQVRARLAAQYVVGLANQNNSQINPEHLKTVYRRLSEKIEREDVARWQKNQGPEKGFAVVEMLAEECVAVLQQAPLTINIEPYKFFGARVKGDRVQSIWNRLRSKDPGYANFREGVENMMFGYMDDEFGQGENIGDVDVSREIARYGGTQGLGANGQPRSHSFVADMRPKYAAVNFTWASFGAASTYGLSHFVLNDYLRLNAVYSPRDSFGLESRSQLGTLFNMYPVLAHCAGYVLDQILVSARNRTPPEAPMSPPNAPMSYASVNEPDADKGSEYIEAILHTEVIFKRDVKEVRIARQEIQDKQTGDVMTQKTWTVKKRTIEKNLNAFLQQHNLQNKVVYI